MGKRNKYGAYIEGITEMNDRGFFEAYINDKNWKKAGYWLNIEIAYLKKKVVCQRILYNLFGLLASFVMAFLTWVALFPSADKKELEAFPIVTTCNNLYIKLCELVPYEKPAEIIGLILIPFVVCLAVAIIAIVLGEIIYKLRCKRFFSSRKDKEYYGSTIKKMITKLGKLYNRYDDEYIALLFYALFAGIFTGGVMVFSSVPFGLNPIEYVIIGVVLDAIYGAIFFAIIYVVHFFKEGFGLKEYPIYNWERTVGRAIGETYYDSTDTDEPEEVPFILDDKTIEVILDDVYSAFENTGIGKDL